MEISTDFMFIHMPLPEGRQSHKLNLHSKAKISRYFQSRSKKPNSVPLQQIGAVSLTSARASKMGRTDPFFFIPRGEGTQERKKKKKGLGASR